MSRQNGKRFAENTKKNNRYKENKNKYNNKKLKTIIIILSVLFLIFVFYIVFKQKMNIFFNNAFNDIKENSKNIDNIKKNVTNLENLEASDLKVENSETQSSISLTITNTSSESTSSQVLSILLLDKEGNTVIPFTAYINELAPNENEVLKMYTKQDVSNVTDFSISKEAD